MSTELTVLENKLPLKAYPEKDLDEKLTTVFKYWLSNLLNLKPEKEEALDNAIQIIKMKFWSMGLHEVKQAFEMYALGELPLTPRSNHIDIVLVGQIFNDYKKNQRTKNKTEISQEDENYYFVVSAYDHFISTGQLETELSDWLYTHLVIDRKLIAFNQEIKRRHFNIHKEDKNQEEAVKETKKTLLKNFFTNWDEKGLHIKHLLNKKQ